RPFGVNVFVPSPDGADRGLLAGYVERVRREAAGYGAPTGEAAWSDDAWEEKLAVLVAERPAVASFAFGCPPPEVIERLGDAGARGAQFGTAFLDTFEAGTPAAHRSALRGGRRTMLTRAFSGRRARGIVNGFLARNGAFAPSAYPHVNALTAPLRAAARERN